jgi:hypothetical protein
MGAEIRAGKVAGVVAAVLLLVRATASWAGDIGQSATEAESLLAQGKSAEALAAFDKAEDAFWTSLPLQVRTAVFVSSATAFAQYEPVPAAAFHAGDSITVYLEPAGYSYAASAGTYSVSLATGIEVRTPGGLTLAKVDDFGSLSWRGREKSREVQLVLKVDLPQLKAGDYRLVLTLTDAGKSQSATATLPFSIVQ